MVTGNYPIFFNGDVLNFETGVRLNVELFCGILLAVMETTKKTTVKIIIAKDPKKRKPQWTGVIVYALLLIFVFNFFDCSTRIAVNILLITTPLKECIDNCSSTIQASIAKPSLCLNLI